jgi:hypothetical protein
MRVFFAHKSGRGLYTSHYGRKRSVHHYKHGGSTELLLVPGLGASNLQGISNDTSKIGSGVSAKSEMLDKKEKVPISNLQNKLEKIHLTDGKKRKNISFIV